MPSYTNRLNLRKTNMNTDGDDFFRFDVDLDDNWDKIDEFAKQEELSGVYFTKIRDMTALIPGRIEQEYEVSYYEVNG